MKKLTKLFLIGAIVTTQVFSYCYPDASCEESLADMSSEMEDIIDDNFDKLEDKIDKAIDEYKKINKELDKEIYVLEVALKGETLLYRKLSEIELYSAQSKQLNDTEISLIINIKELLGKKQKEGVKNEQKKN